MEQEVKHFSRVKTNLHLIVKDLQLKMAGLTKENEGLMQKIQAQKKEKQEFKDDIHNCLNLINDYKACKACFVRIYKKWVNN